MDASTPPEQGIEASTSEPGMDAMEAESGRAGDPDKFDSTSARVLLVDDDELIVNSLSKVLRRHGFRVFSADCGEAALAIAQEFTIDIAICDRRMPGMDGIELLERLHKLQPTCWRVLLTGGLDLSTTVDAVNRGSVSRVLEKPVLSNALIEIVHDALRARKQLVAAYRELEREDDYFERVLVTNVLSSEHLQLAFQPIVWAESGTIFGYEALLRSSHSTFDGPGSVIRAVERHSLVDGLAEVVFDRALEWFKGYVQRDVDQKSKLFLNLHPRELANPKSLERRLRTLEPFATRVVLEVTERSSIYGVSAWEQSVATIRDLGFEIAVDDLGAGYSALAVLAELKPQYIKVDMSIVRDADRDTHKQRLLDLLCRFAEATEARLIAEGIETEAEAATVKASGAHLLQGFLFGKPRLLSHLQLVGQREPEGSP